MKVPMYYLGEWGVMDSLVSELPDDDLDTTFLKAVLSVHQVKLRDAMYSSSYVNTYDLGGFSGVGIVH